MKRWTIDPDHSVAAFAIRHMMIADVRGQFNMITGTILLDPGDPAAASVEMVIEVASVVTGVRKRDEHLCSSDFFDAHTHPHIIFRSSRIEPLGHNRARINGELTIRGNTRGIVLEATFSGPVQDPFGDGISLGFSASTVLNREDFGIIWNQEMAGGGIMVGREVRLDIDLEADLSTA